MANETYQKPVLDAVADEPSEAISSQAVVAVIGLTAAAAALTWGTATITSAVKRRPPTRTIPDKKKLNVVVLPPMNP